MAKSAAGGEPSRSGPPDDDPSVGRLLLVWILVGFSVMGLGADLAAAIPVAFPLSTIDVGLLFGTAVVVALWVAGFRPSIPASVAYFVLQSVGHLWLVVAVGPLVFPGTTIEPWQDVVLRTLSILLAAALGFTVVGRRLGSRLRRFGRRVLKLPPADESGNARQ